MIYKSIGDIVEFSSTKNVNGEANVLYGININKFFMPSVANIIGVDLKKYKVVKKHQFACNRMHVGRDKRLPISMSTSDYNFIVSPAYNVFTVIDDEVLPEYLMLWFRRSEFDRECWFYTDADVRGGLSLNALKSIEIYIPSIEKQRDIVVQYQSITNKIKVNEQICEKLEATAQALYKHWFVDFEFPNEDGNSYKTSGGVMVYNQEMDREIPVGWELKKLEQIASLKYGKMLDSSLFLKKGYPVFSGYGIRGYYTEFMYEKPQILVLCRGVSGTGEVKLSPKYAYITNLSIVVEIIKPLAAKMYLYYYLKNAGLRTLDSGSAQSMITTGDLYFQDVLIPKVEIQDIFEMSIQSIKNQNASIESQNQKLTELQSLLLSRLATLDEREKEKVY